MGVTDDPNDPRLKRGVDTEKTEQHEVYLVLSPEEIAKGFVRPYRDSYIHEGIRPKYALRDLNQKELGLYSDYSKYEEYPESESPKIGRFWTEDELKSGCGVETHMGLALSQTYARNPQFYGSTYCISCKKHLPVAEFRWSKDNEVVGS